MPQTAKGLRYWIEPSPKKGRPSVWKIQYVNANYETVKVYLETKQQALEYLRNMNPADVRDYRFTTALDWEW